MIRFLLEPFLLNISIKKEPDVFYDKKGFENYHN